MLFCLAASLVGPLTSEITEPLRHDLPLCDRPVKQTFENGIRPRGNDLFTLGTLRLIRVLFARERIGAGLGHGTHLTMRI